MAKSCKTPLLRFVEARKEYLDLNVMAGLTEESESFKKSVMILPLRSRVISEPLLVFPLRMPIL